MVGRPDPDRASETRVRQARDGLFIDTTPRAGGDWPLCIRCSSRPCSPRCPERMDPAERRAARDEAEAVERAERMETAHLPEYVVEPMRDPSDNIPRILTQPKKAKP